MDVVKISVNIITVLINPINDLNVIVDVYIDIHVVYDSLSIVCCRWPLGSRQCGYLPSRARRRTMSLIRVPRIAPNIIQDQQ